MGDWLGTGFVATRMRRFKSYKQSKMMYISQLYRNSGLRSDCCSYLQAHIAILEQLRKEIMQNVRDEIFRKPKVEEAISLSTRCGNLCLSHRRIWKTTIVEKSNCNRWHATAKGKKLKLQIDKPAVNRDSFILTEAD